MKKIITTIVIILMAMTTIGQNFNITNPKIANVSYKIGEVTMKSEDCNASLVINRDNNVCHVNCDFYFVIKEESEYVEIPDKIDTTHKSINGNFSVLTRKDGSGYVLTNDENKILIDKIDGYKGCKYRIEFHINKTTIKYKGRSVNAKITLILMD